jgi:hypothetical protein
MASNLEIPDLRQRIISKDWKVRLQAAGRLAEFADTKTAGVAANILFDAIQDSHDEVRTAVFQSFVRLGEPAIVQLIRRLGCNDFEHDYQDDVVAENMLVRIGEPAVPALTKAASGDNPCAHMPATRALIRIRSKPKG